MKTVELDVNVKFDNEKFKELFNEFVNNNLQFIINDRLKSIINQCIEVE